MAFQYVSDSELRHTYPYGKHDIEVDFTDKETLASAVNKAFASDPNCRRVVVKVEQDNVEQISTCEDAGLRYVLNVQLRTLEEVSLMVAEPDWVSSQSTAIEDLELS